MTRADIAAPSATPLWAGLPGPGAGHPGHPPGVQQQVRVYRDELYFIVCGLHPALGYVDQPPLTPWIAAASFKLFGTALTPLRSSRRS